MEEKLEEFRARRAKDKQRVMESKDPSQVPSQKIELLNTKTVNDFVDTTDIDEGETECGYVTRILIKLYSFNFLLKVALWTCLFFFFIQIGFGAVYFIVSMTFLMIYSMKNKRKSYEPSAYSVFNKNFEKIDGTFTAEQFERQMIYGGAVR